MNNNHPRIVLIIVCSLAGLSVLGLTFTFLLILWHAEGSMVAILAGMTGSCIGSLATLLASTKSSPAQTEIVNTPANPVPTDPQPKP